MANWSLPTLTSTYTNFLTELDSRLNDLVYGLDPALTTVTNPKTNSTRWNSAANRWEKYNGSTWAALSAAYDINVTSATKWTTGRTIGLTGDITGTSGAFDGSGNLSFATTLATVNSNVGSFGSATAVPIITVNGKGLITAVNTAALGTIATQAANNVSLTGGSISATNLTLVQSTTAAPTANGRVEWDNDSFTLMIGTGAATKTFSPNDGTATLTNKTMSTGCSWGGTAIAVASGGTGATDAATARTNLGLGTIATQAANSVSLTGGTISGTNLTLVQSVSAAPTINGRVEWDSDTFTLMIGTGAATKTFAPNDVAATFTNKTMSTGCSWGGTAIPVANGGTGATDAATARTNLGLGALATLASINNSNWSGTALAVANGGTGATDAATARTNLGITYANLGTLGIANGGTGNTTASAALAALGGMPLAGGIFTGDVTWSGTGRRFFADFSNATLTSRALFQSSTTNGATNLGVLPNGTSQVSTLALINNSTPTNSSNISLSVNATEAAVQSGIMGTGTYLPLKLYAGASGSATLDTSGNFTATGNVTAYSDRRLKKDLKVISHALERIEGLVGYTYTRKVSNTREAGLMAQDVQQVLPEAVLEHPDGTLSLAYGNLVALLIEGIKELRAEVRCAA